METNTLAVFAVTDNIRDIYEVRTYMYVHVLVIVGF